MYIVPQKIGGPIRVVRVTGEWMSDFVHRSDAREECEREGFPHLTPAAFYAFFRGSHKDPGLDDLRVNRIEFEYTDPRTQTGSGA